MKLFSELVKVINEFLPDDPMRTESELEQKIMSHLHDKGFNVSSQISKRHDRYDLVCRNINEVVCIELKLRADISDIKQFDKYLPKFKDGIIVVCWQASFSVQDIFHNVAEQSPIPIALIELSRKYSIA